MNDTALTKEIIQLEKKYWNALREKDWETARDMTDFPCIVAGAHGVRSVSLQEYEKMFKSGRETIGGFELDESKAEVRQLGSDTAVIAYPVHSQFTLDGKTRDIRAVDTSTWIKRDGRWVCAMHSETEVS